jgi:hypothetical protein
MAVNDTITTGFVVEFKAGWELAAQQKDSRLQATITDVGGVTGTSFTFNTLAATAANDVTNRLGDTEWSDQTHSTRIVLMQDKDWATPIDQFDLPKLLASPQGEYMQNGIAALNRKKDSVIYNALLGTALTRTQDGHERRFHGCEDAAGRRHGRQVAGLQLGAVRSVEHDRWRR